jgi:hypothetical protein
MATLSFQLTALTNDVFYAGCTMCDMIDAMVERYAADEAVRDAHSPQSLTVEIATDWFDWQVTGEADGDVLLGRTDDTGYGLAVDENGEVHITDTAGARV